jgi:hypothetical protein
MSLFGKEEPKAIVLRTGKQLACVICGFDRFYEREAQLNTPVATFFKFDWANATGECWVCGRCGYIHWFLGAQ